MERIGFVGLGTMGAAMAGHLVRSGHPLTVWNRTPGRAADLVAAGAVEAPDPARLAAASDVVVVCVSDTPDVEAVLFGSDGVAAGAPRGSLVIDCSTIAPAATRDFATRLADRGIDLVDAPVSGGSEGAQKATLTIFVGGEPAAVERARPILDHLGKTITHVGPVGAGQAVKAVNQVILAGTYLGVAEGIVLALKAGLDVDQVVGALGGGAAQSWVLANRSGRMIANDYPLGFKVALHLKDLGIGLALADELGADLPGQPAVRRDRAERRRVRATPTRTSRRSRGSSRSGPACPTDRRVSAAGTASSGQGRARRPEQEQRLAELARVDRPEPLDVVQPLDVDLARSEPRVGHRGVGVVAIADRDHPSMLALGDEVHGDVGERHRDHLVERVRLAAPKVVGQLARDGLDARPRAEAPRPVPRRR